MEKKTNETRGRRIENKRNVVAEVVEGNNRNLVAVVLREEENNRNVVAVVEGN